MSKNKSPEIKEKEEHLGTICVVKRVFLYKPADGSRASIHGSRPPGYEVRKEGYTWRVTDRRGSITYGLCRTPEENYEEALQVAKNAARLMGYSVIEDEDENEGK